MPEEAKWYVVHTYSGYENKVASNLEKTVENRNLQDMIQEIKVPTETVTEIKDDKTHEVERKLYPGYVFIKMIYTDETWSYAIYADVQVLSGPRPSQCRFQTKKCTGWALKQNLWKFPIRLVILYG